MHIIGLTGGIGSGKSTVAALLRERGIAVVDADPIAREIVAPGSPVLSQLAKRFGLDMLNSDGTLNRSLLAKQVFHSPAALRDLNQLTHPPILAKIQQALLALERAGAPVAVIEAPLLFETGLDKLCRNVILITANPGIRMERLKARDGLSDAECKARIQAQWPDDEKRRKSSHVIDNSGHIIQTAQQLDGILTALQKIKP